MTHPILYTFRRCPWAMRARIALHYAGLQCEVREVHLRNKPAALLEISPKGTVPTLVLSDGVIIDESMDVILYALRRNDPDGWLEASIMETSQLLNTAEEDFMKVAHRYKYHERYPEETQEQSRKKCETILIQGLEQRLASNPYLLGDKPSVADVGIFPLIRQFAAVDQDWWLSAPYPNTRAWLDRWMESPHYLGVMQKRKPWKEGDKPVWFLEKAS